MESDCRSGSDCWRQPGGSDGVQAGGSRPEGIGICKDAWCAAGASGGDFKESHHNT